MRLSCVRFFILFPSSDNRYLIASLFTFSSKAYTTASKAFLFNVPQCVFVNLCELFGKKDIAERLCGDLQVDIKHTKEALNWTPPYTVQQAIKKTVLSFISKN